MNKIVKKRELAPVKDSENVSEYAKWWESILVGRSIVSMKWTTDGNASRISSIMLDDSTEVFITVKGVLGIQV